MDPEAPDVHHRRRGLLAGGFYSKTEFSEGQFTLNQGFLTQGHRRQWSVNQLVIAVRQTASNGAA